MGKIGERVGRGVRWVRRMFHLVIGLAFLFLAAAGGEFAFKLWNEHQNRPEQGFITFDLVAGFTVVLVIFCLYSFAKARSVR